MLGTEGEGYRTGVVEASRTEPSQQEVTMTRLSRMTEVFVGRVTEALAYCESDRA